MLCVFLTRKQIMRNHTPKIVLSVLTLALATSPLVSMAQTVENTTRSANSAVSSMDETSQKIDAGLARHYNADRPGATVIVTRDGKTILRKAYGLSNVENKTALRPDTLMLIGSISKQFTAVAILQLIEAGKLSLDDDIHSLLPQLPNKGQKISIAQLLSHTSGVRNFFALPGFGELVTKQVTVPQVFDFFKNDTLESPPGERFAYSNTGYFLLGLVIEKVSGMSYANYMQQNIFKPLQMQHTAYEGQQAKQLMHSQGYFAENATPKQVEPLSIDIAYAAGGLVSTVDDLARWDRAVSEQKLISPAAWNQAFKPYKLNNGSESTYGFGWMTLTVRGAPAYGHDGIIPGYNAFALRIPKHKVYVAVLSNYSNLQPDTAFIGTTIAAIAMGNPFPEYQAITLPAEQLEQFVGSYRIDDKENRIITSKGTQLFMQRGNRPPIEIFAYANQKFFLKDSPTRAHLSFDLGANGKAHQMTMTQNDISSILPRIEPSASK
jgi:D-alanyl-D-alanine carboxypeptidase